MATMATAARDIHATSPRDTLTGVAARSVPVTRGHPLPLPTPPNSLSPALPPHGLRAQLQKARLEAIDSDLDLHEDQDLGDHPSTAAAAAAAAAAAGGSGNSRALGSPPYDSAGVITPTMLARHHLPEILLNHGPLAIRHIMGYLTTSVPGFAGIPPAKARRLVVGALEGRGSGGEGGGVDGDVEFEKVGWGRWDARRPGQPARSAAAAAGAERSGNGIPIGRGGGASSGWGGVDRSRLHASAGSSAGESAAFSHDDRDMTMLDHEADKMSMDDGSASASCSEAPDDDDVAMNDDPEDVTDDEDWAAVGAAALRAASYSNPPPTNNRNNNNLSSRVYTSGAGLRSVSYNAGMARAPQTCRGLDFSAFGGTSDAQEREAVEALLRLGSV